jgi:dihydropteroate synthase
VEAVVFQFQAVELLAQVAQVVAVTAQSKQPQLQELLTQAEEGEVLVEMLQQPTTQQAQAVQA